MQARVTREILTGRDRNKAKWVPVSPLAVTLDLTGLGRPLVVSPHLASPHFTSLRLDPSPGGWVGGNGIIHLSCIWYLPPYYPSSFLHSSCLIPCSICNGRPSALPVQDVGCGTNGLVHWCNTTPIDRGEVLDSTLFWLACNVNLVDRKSH